MFTENLTDRDDVIGLECEGKLTIDDFKRMHALIHERLAVSGKPALVLDLTQFEGYETPAALLEDLKIDTAHANDFGRVAVIGERRWMEWGTKFVDKLTRAEIRWFDPAEISRAVEWAQNR